MEGRCCKVHGSFARMLVVPLKECYKSSTISTKQTRSKMIDVDFNIKKKPPRKLGLLELGNSPKKSSLGIKGTSLSIGPWVANGKLRLECVMPSESEKPSSQWLFWGPRPKNNLRNTGLVHPDPLEAPLWLWILGCQFFCGDEFLRGSFYFNLCVCLSTQLWRGFGRFFGKITKLIWLNPGSQPRF